MIPEFQYFCPVRVNFGIGVAEKAGEEAAALKATKVMVVTDKVIKKAGIIEPVLKSLENVNIPYLVYDEVVPNPRDVDVEEGARIASKEGVDLLIGIGGGSAMDTAKGIGILIAHGSEKIIEFEDPACITKKSMPIIAIPTTAGTGSEVTTFAVITDTSRSYKMCMWSPLLAPEVALVDPMLTKSVPPGVTASTGLDALAHAVECYTCKVASPVTDALSIYAVKLIYGSLRKAVADGNDEEARTNMMLGSLIAGMAFGYADVGAPHCMGEAIGGRYNIPHGVTCAIFLPVVIEYNMDGDYKKHADLAVAMGVNPAGKSVEELAQCAIDIIQELCRELKIPNIREVGVKEEDFELLARASAASVSSASNPKEVGFDEYMMLFRRTWDAAK